MKSFKIAFLFLFYSNFNFLHSQQTHEDLIYEVVTQFCKDENRKKIEMLPMRSHYSKSYCLSDTCELDGVDWFLERVSDSPLCDSILISDDYEFMRSQIFNPVITKYRKNKLRRIRVIKHSFLLNMALPISLPIFSTDFNFAIITGAYFGMTRTFLYRRNPSNLKWEVVDMLWQSGS